jgi:hypothetical protein
MISKGRKKDESLSRNGSFDTSVESDDELGRKKMLVKFKQQKLNI